MTDERAAKLAADLDQIHPDYPPALPGEIKELVHMSHTTYTIAPKIEFMISGSEIHGDVWAWGAWNGRTREPSTLRPVEDPIGSGYDALVRAMRAGEITKRGLRVQLDETARQELIAFLEAMYIGARDSEDYNDMTAIRRCFKALGTEVMV